MLNNILDLLRSDGSIVVNKRLAAEIGLVEAVIYSELVSLHKYWSDRGELVDGDWFYCTFPNLEKNTTIKERTARKHVTKLEKLGLIESELKGLPSKKHYRITDGILEVLGLVPNKVGKNDRPDNTNSLEAENDGKQCPNQISKICRPRSANFADLDQQNLPTNNTNTNNTNISSSRDSRSSIDLKLKEKYTHAPFNEIKEQMLNDNTLTIETDKQYKSMLEYRLKNWKPKITKPKRMNPVRTEILPEWFDDKVIEQQPITKDGQKDLKQKKKELQETLKELKKMDQQEKRDL